MTGHKQVSLLPYLVAWLVLMALLGVSVTSAYLDIGAFHAVVAFGVAATQAAIVFIVFMRLRGGSSLNWVFAGAGFFWLLFLFGLGAVDYATRTGFPVSDLLGSHCRMINGIRVGTAGWNVPRQHAAKFPGEGTHLQRYAQFFPAVEINSSFYRPHRPGTYARWAASVPPGFRFAAKLPREISHIRKLVAITEPLERFVVEIRALGDRLGPVLVQLPPSLRYDETVAGAFLDTLRQRFDGDVVCEPRHVGWFTDAVDAMLSKFRVARVAADPPPVPRAGTPGGWPGIAYRRLHGSPKMYYSGYPAEALDTVARLVRESAAQERETWCIFDNTALGEAAGDARGLLALLSSSANKPAEPA